jgi:hypothetical protein
MAIIRSSVMAVLDAPEVHPEKIKRGHRALNVREHPDALCAGVGHLRAQTISYLAVILDAARWCS